MTLERHPHATELLCEAGRLLLENNESAREIDHALTATARRLTRETCRVVVSYERVAVSFGHEPPVIARVSELRFNAALQARVHSLLARLQRGELDAGEALAALTRLEVDTPRHPRWLAATLLGAAAASLARLLGADSGASLIDAIAVGLGYIVRQELARRRFSVLAMPFVAALIGAVLGGLAIRRGWTATPALALIVPSLILVPGPHIINGILDLVDNYVPLGVARLALAASILASAALGITVGMELTLGEVPGAKNAAGPALGVLADMLLAGVVTCGFALAYNTEWSRVAMAMIGGMFGHGLRYVALQSGCTLGAATFVGGVTVGIVSAYIAKSTKSPFAVIAFAGAVTMMPGVQIYRALGGALKLARLNDAVDAPSLEDFVGNGLQACVVAGALALGLVVGLRVVALLTDRGGASGSRNA
jgi:uncharacterized membrane protein YjjP (DUF1212 family)